MKITRFERTTKEELKHYVYLLIDPRTELVFYVGKASGNDRAFDHMTARATEGNESRKAKLIAEIQAECKRPPEIHILRHGLKNSEIAEEVEAAVIDAIGLENLTNECRGKWTVRGRAKASELNRRYGSPSIRESSLQEPFMKIWINKTYSPTLNEHELYDATRQFWFDVGLRTRTPDANGNLRYPKVLALVDNVVVMVYRVFMWLPAGSTMSSRTCEKADVARRWEFVGNAIPDHNLVGKRLVDDEGRVIRGNQLGYGYIN